LETLWFWIVTAMLAVYVILDGFDLGAGALHLALARDEAERRLVLRSIGPVWDGNEVWLVAAGGVLFLAFPVLYAASFSGFYLPLMIVLWLLMLRGVAIEFRGHVASRVWGQAWDATFAGASALLAVFYGAALGNVVRGVPLDGEGSFFEPLWTDLSIEPPTGILDWFTLSVGALSLAALAMHGALWVAHKTEGGLQARARRAAAILWWGAAALTGGVTLLTFQVQPHVAQQLASRPWGLALPAVALAGLLTARSLSARGADLRAFLASCTYLAGMMGSVAFGLYPYVLPANGTRAFSLTIVNAAASAHGLRVGLAWWIPGILLATAYVAVVYRQFRGKTGAEGGGY
jgi:cytochrome d ubiquinol oxidase subunit II